VVQRVPGAASDREAQRLGLQALTAGDGFGQGLARAAAALLGTRLVDFLGALGGRLGRMLRWRSGAVSEPSP